MKRRIGIGKIMFTAITILAVLAVIALTVFRPRPPAPGEALPEQRVAVTVWTVEPRTLPDAIALPGRMEPFNDVIVSAEQAGRIISLDVADGERVRQGDILLRLDERLWRTELQRTELVARDAHRDLARLRDLRATGAVSQSDLDAAEMRAATADLAREEAAIRLEKCAPATPIDGIVEDRRVAIGETVNPGQALFRLVDTARIKVVFYVPERDVMTLRPGASYPFDIKALPGRELSGELGFIATAADPGNNAYRAELWTDNPGGEIRAGMLAQVNLVRSLIEDAVILPLRAIVPMKGEALVYVVERGYAERRIVRIGAIIDAQAVIRDGIAIGDRVILDGNRTVLDGTPVTVMDDWQPAPVGAITAGEPEKL